MSARRLTSLLIVSCAVALLFAAVSCKRVEKAAVEKGKTPDFTLSGINGRKVTLSMLRGKVVVLEFWATWCPPCRESVPEMERLYKKFKGKNFELLAVSLDQGGSALSEVSAFAKEQGITYPVLLDDDKASAAFGVSNIPVIFIIDKTGKIVEKHVGFMLDLSETLSKEIGGLL